MEEDDDERDVEDDVVLLLVFRFRRFCWECGRWWWDRWRDDEEDLWLLLLLPNDPYGSNENCSGLSFMEWWPRESYRIEVDWSK